MHAPLVEKPGERLAERFLEVRAQTIALTAPLSAEDMQVQSMADVSPTKWHLAHTSWFFEAFVLGRFAPAHRAFDPSFATLFNSYYEAMGPRHPRPARGLLSRPSLETVRAYRAFVDEKMLAFLPYADEAARAIVELGLHHEQQHQELILTDVLHVLSSNPACGAYRTDARVRPVVEATPLKWHERDGGVIEIGHRGEGFAFDNEGPRHRVFLEPFAIASRLVTNGELIDFIDDGGYARPALWLSDGWAAVQAHEWSAPHYWRKVDGAYLGFSLNGLAEIDRAAPASHVSFYEAEAYARWAGARLPSEAEWEHVASSHPTPPTIEGNFLESGELAPTAARASKHPSQLFGDVWEWTGSPHAPYPRYRPLDGALGEYNGKFMCNQLVLRGGSCLTPRSHVRATYRNFFPPSARWQMSGLRLARAC